MKENPVVLALDLSITRTGWAVSDLDGTTSGAQSFTPAKGQHPALRYRTFYAWLDAMIQLHQPDVVLFEEPACRGQGGSQDALIGIKTRLDELCAVHGIPLKGLYPSALKLAFTGDGWAWKFEMQGRAQMIWPDYDADKDEGCDEADARALTWVYSNKPEVFEPKPPKKRKPPKEAKPSPALTKAFDLLLK